MNPFDSYMLNKVRRLKDVRTRPPSRLRRLRRTAVCGDGREGGAGGRAGGGPRVRHRRLAAGVRADPERRKRVNARAGRPARGDSGEGRVSGYRYEPI